MIRSFKILTTFFVKQSWAKDKKINENLNTFAQNGKGQTVLYKENTLNMLTLLKSFKIKTRLLIKLRGG